MYEGALVADRYRLEARIGSGSMGQVWRATDERLQRVVGVKLVDLSQSNEAVTPERFRREVIATARLNHPNIVTIFDAGTDADLAFLVMELLPGQSLAQLVRSEGVLDVDRVVDVALQVARALEAAHAIGVVHRDIKPANIMVSGSTAKILDFGIAQLATDTGATLTNAATALGTAAYMSPEQALGTKPGVETDIYSLGCVLMALLTGAPPFTGQNSIEVANRQINEPPPLVSDRRPDVRPAIDELVASMLAKDPSRRPSARQLSDALLRQRRGAIDPTAVLPARTTVLPVGAAAPPGRTAAPPAGAAVPPGRTSVLSSATRVDSVPPPRTSATPSSVPSAVRLGASNGSAGPVTGSSRAPGGGWFGRGLRLILAVVAVVVILAVLWVGGSALVRGLSTQAGSSPSGRTTQTRSPVADGPVLPTIDLPSVSAPTLPSANTAARRAAVFAVSGALKGLSPSTDAGRSTKETLIDAWDSAGANIVAGKNETRELTTFSKSVERAHQRGAISDAEFAAVSLALRSVASLI